MINTVDFISYLLDDITDEEERLKISEIAKYFDTTKQEVLAKLEGLDLIYAVKDGMLIYTRDLKEDLFDLHRIFNEVR